MEKEKEMWSEEMWKIWEGDGSGVVHIGGEPYEYGLIETEECSAIDVPAVWLRLVGKDSPVVTSDIKRDDPLYVNGDRRFKDMVETVRLIHNILSAKGAGVLSNLAT